MVVDSLLCLRGVQKDGIPYTGKYLESVKVEARRVVED